MFLFLRLLLAHFIADFPLQTTRVYLLKAGDGCGKWAHSAIVFLVSVLFVFPYWGAPDIWFYLVGAGLVHHLSDGAKLALNRALSNRSFLFLYVADQCIHVLTVSFILLMSISAIRLEVPGTGLFASLYNSDFWILYAILLVISTYFTTYFIEAFKKSYYPDRFQEVLPAAYKYYGILERACLFHLAYWGGAAWAFVPLALAPRFLLARVSPGLLGSKIVCTSFLEIFWSLLLGVAPGLAFRYLVPLL
jgi:hypothetical protein